MIEQHPLEPFLPPGARILFLGSFPPPRNRWCMDFYYPNFQNDMWRIMGLVFFDDPMHFVKERCFDREKICAFCTEQGIALSDTVRAAIRKSNNASDSQLQVVRPLDLQDLLARIPDCETIAVTGQKAADTLFGVLKEGPVPAPGQFTDLKRGNKPLRIWRMPSTSRAYPMKLERKAEVYRSMFRSLKRV
ncbi:MAG: uracil-DNA glycosylase family protein [Bacteroidales bacterium]